MTADVIETQAVIVGAGPVGLFQAFQLGLQDIRCHIVDALPHVGGQCVELYADKPIYDIPGIARCTGAELIARLREQVAPFAPQFHLNQEVAQLQRLDDGRWQVQTAPVLARSAAGVTQGQTFITHTVFIAAGVGAFQPRKLSLEGAAMLEGRHVHYQLEDLGVSFMPDRLAQEPAASAATTCTNQDVWVLGGEASALAAALRLIDLPPAQAPRRVTLLHRRDVFQAEPALVQAMRDAVAQDRLQLQIGQATALIMDQTQPHPTLNALQIATADGQLIERPAQHILALLGVSPKLGPVAHWGLAMERKQLQVSAEDFSTSESGVFAVGDINTYPGKKKLILCGFHEATLAAFGAAALVHPSRKTLLQYTTTSTELHRLLGIV